jgi:tetratricopeptide (TPR) repeat protein
MRDETFAVAEAVVTALPDSPDALCLLATVHRRHANDAVAIRLWQECLQRDPDFADAHLSLGQLELERGHYADAESHLREALRSDPNNSAVPLPLAEALTHRGKIEEAVAVLETYLKKNAWATQGWCRLGQAHQYLDDHEQAGKCFQQALSQDADCADACYGLAVSLRRLGQDSEARQHLERFRQLQSRQQRAELEHRPDFDDEDRMRMTLINTHMAAGRIYLVHNRPLAAIPHAEEAAALDTQHRESREMLCQLYVTHGRIDDAARVCKSLCDLESRDPRQWMNLGKLCYQCGRLDESEMAYRKVIELSPDTADGYLMLAQIQMSPQRDPQEAVQLARTGIKLAPTAEHYYILSEVYRNTGDLASARTALHESITLAPDDRRYQEAYSRLQQEPRQ